MDVSPNLFFDLSNFAHPQLFEGCESVWEALARLSDYLKQQQLGEIEVDIPEGVTIVQPETVSIGKGCRLEPGAYIHGPCIIGENSEVRQGAYIRGNFIAGRACVIGHASEVKHAIFLDGAHAAHFAYVGDSILGNDVNLGAGVKCANVRLDRQEVIVRHGRQRVGSGLRKFGAIIGDCCQIGCNTVLNPGTLLGREVSCAPCIAVGGVIPARHRISDGASLKIEPYEGVEAFLTKKR
jgi:NDP-sugar pyrophosphorylase family protein